MKKLIVIIALLMLTKVNVLHAQIDSIIKSAHFKVETEGVKPYEYIQFYSENGRLDSVYTKPNWADSNFTEMFKSEEYIYLQNGEIDYLMEYDYEDIIGQLLFIKNYIYENDTTDQEHRFDSLRCLVREYKVYGDGNLREYIKVEYVDEEFIYDDVIDYWVIKKYNKRGQLQYSVDLLKNNYTVHYGYNENGLIEDVYLLTPKTYKFTDDDSKYYSYKYFYNENKHWVKRFAFNDLYDEEELDYDLFSFETITRIIEYY